MKKNKVVNKTNNAVNVIFPYRTKHGTWVYDDESLNTYEEAFVCGSSEVIDAIVGTKVNKCKVTISSSPLPNSTITLHKIDKEDGIEGWYRAEPLGMEHWLCSKVLDYFPNYPKNIYVKIESYE